VSSALFDPFEVRRRLDTGAGSVWIFDLPRLAEHLGKDLATLPYSIRI